MCALDVELLDCSSQEHGLYSTPSSERTSQPSHTPQAVCRAYSPLLAWPVPVCIHLQAYFRSKVRAWDEQQGGQRPYGSLRIAVRRDHLFEDSFHQLRSRTAGEMRQKLNVTFQVGRCMYAVLRGNVAVECTCYQPTPHTPRNA